MSYAFVVICKMWVASMTSSALLNSSANTFLSWWREDYWPAQQECDMWWSLVWAPEENKHVAHRHDLILDTAILQLIGPISFLSGGRGGGWGKEREDLKRRSPISADPENDALVVGVWPSCQQIRRPVCFLLGRSHLDLTRRRSDDPPHTHTHHLSVSWTCHLKWWMLSKPKWFMCVSTDLTRLILNLLYDGLLLLVLSKSTDYQFGWSWDPTIIHLHHKLITVRFLITWK